MFISYPSDRIHTSAAMASEGQQFVKSFWVAPDVGIFLVDIELSDGEVTWVQARVFPATVEGAIALHECEAGIIQVAYLQSRNADPQRRSTPVMIHGIDIATDPARGMALVLILHWGGGSTWTPIGTTTPLANLMDRAKLVSYTRDDHRSRERSGRDAGTGSAHG